MTAYVKQGKTLTPTDDTSYTILDLLPGSTYTIKQIPITEILVLEQIDNFELNHKLYGKLNMWTNRIISTFQSREASTGVMFTGAKGSGKSLLAKNICIEANKLGMPVIVINAPWRGEDFNKLIQNVAQPAVVVFDEFEKTYGFKEQMEILTLLDGTFPTKKLFVFTLNDKFSVDGHMKNRPGRIYYMIDFNALEEGFIAEYCEDNLIDKEKISQIIRAATFFSAFNFDMLKAVVEEVNRYGESVKDAFAMLNVRPEFDETSVGYNAFMATSDGTPVELYRKVLRENPFTSTFGMSYTNKTVGFDRSTASWEHIEFSPDDIAHVKQDQIVYIKDNFTLTLIRKPAVGIKPDWYADI